MAFEATVESRARKSQKDRSFGSITFGLIQGGANILSENICRILYQIRELLDHIRSRRTLPGRDR